MSRNKAAKELSYVERFEKDIAPLLTRVGFSSDWKQRKHKLKKRAGSGGHLRRKGKQ